MGASFCLFIEIQNPQDVVKWNGKAYQLIGTTKSEMKDHEVMALSLRLPGTDFSKAKYKGGYNPGLITSFAKKVLENSVDFQINVNEMSSNEILHKLNLFETNTAGILFGDFSYRIVHFNEDGDILDQKIQKGLYHILSETFIEELQSRARKKGTDTKHNSISVQEESPYPIKALREILANAVAHTLYQESGGDIVVETHPNRITVRNNCSREAKAFIDKWFSRINKPANKHLMNTLRIPKITDEQGSGKIRVFRLMLEAGKREPIASFQSLGSYGRWEVTLFNEEGNIVIKRLADEIKSHFQDKDQWRLAIALLLWQDYEWSKIETFLDDHYKYVASQMLENKHAPVMRYDNRLYVKRWAKVRLERGQITKQFTEGEKVIWYKLLNSFSFAVGQEGHISSAKAREIIGLSNSTSEMTQLARLFSEWKKDDKIKMIKKGHWKFTRRYAKDGC